MFSHCIICESSSLKEVFNNHGVPLVPNSPLQTKSDENLIVDLDIVQCQNCGHIFNQSFDPNLIPKIYGHNYSSGLPTKKVLEKFQKILDDGVGAEVIKNSEVLEIGASNLDLSHMMLKMGAKSVLAFEPSDLFDNEDPRISLRKEFFSDQTKLDETERPSLVIMRHVLEHLPYPARTYANIVRNMKLGGYFYVEVPNAEDIISNSRFYDFFYEHVSYFRADHLTALAKLNGCEVVKKIELANGQHMGMLVKKVDTTIKPVTEISQVDLLNPDDCTSMKKSALGFVEALKDIFNKYDKVAIYGAGNHAICAASMIEDAPVQCFLDQNSLKDGKFAPKSLAEIVHPGRADLENIDCIVIIASLHQDEIYKDLTEKFSFKGSLWGTYPSFGKLR